MDGSFPFSGSRRVLMKILRLSELDQNAVAEVVEFLHANQVTGSQSKAEIRDFITGRWFEHGKYFLAGFIDEILVATVGAVVAEAARQKIYITALTSLAGYESCFDTLINRLNIDLSHFENCSIKLGVRTGQVVSEDLLSQNGFAKAYSLLKLFYAGTPQPEDNLFSIRLETLSADNLLQFIDTMNKSFESTYNAATIDESEARELLSERTNLCGMIFHEGLLKGAYELKLVQNDGWIEGIGVLPEFRGKGLGKLFVQKLILELKSRGAEEVLLTVIDENKQAFRLYEKMNFKVEHKVSDWYERTVS